MDGLNGRGPLTIFAPSNAAISHVRQLFSRLTRDETISVLKHHVVSGLYTSDNLPATLTGQAGGVIETESLHIAKPDIKTANGIIHIIDEVLVPE
jgi:uncharacterized surface protein with fasciclin (FAS1) repeats